MVTGAGDYNRVKVALSDNLGGYLAYTNNYTVNSDGDYVWTLSSVAAPSETTKYAVDLRSSKTNVYLRDYSYYDVEIEKPAVKSITHEIKNGKIYFTVVTKAGDYNRVKVALSDNLGGYLAYTNNYTVNSDGNYVWTLSGAAAPSESTKYAVDMRSASTNKYFKEYCYYDVEIAGPVIKSVECAETAKNLTFTVVSAAGNYNRLRCGLTLTTVNNIRVTDTHTVNSDGNFVWSITIAKPAESTRLYFDLRDAETGKFIKENYAFDYEA